MAKPISSINLDAKRELDDFLKSKVTEKRNVSHFKTFIKRISDHFKTFIKRISDHFYDILIFIFMIVIFFFVIRNGGSIKKNVVDLLVGFSAVGTVFFMYLTFRETKRTNDLKISEVEFERFQKKVEALANKYQMLKLISDEDVKFINEELGEFPVTLPKIKYNRFSELLSELKKLIEKQPDYIRCKELLSDRSIVTVEDTSLLNRIPKLTKALKIIESSLAGIQIESFILFYLFNEIEDSSLNETQKKVLILKLYECAFEFVFVYLSYLNKDYLYKNILSLEIIEVKESNLLVKKDVFFESMVLSSRLPYNICLRYLPSHIKY